MKLQNWEKKYYILLIFFSLIILGWLFSLNHKSIQVSYEQADSFISSSIKSCYEVGGSTQCLASAASDFTSQFPLELILKVFAENEYKPDFFAMCHGTLHFIGREVYKINGSVAKALPQCTSVCFEACSHGVLEGYFQTNNLSSIEKICGKKENFEKPELYNQCLHGLGHGLMFITEADLPKSLKYCDSLNTQQDRDQCYGGVFMENSTSSTNKEHPSRYLKAEDSWYPCNILEDRYLRMCYILQGFYVAQSLQYDTLAVIESCAGVPKKYQPSCFSAIGQVKVGHTQDPKEVKNECYLISDNSYIDACIEGAVGAMANRYAGNMDKIIDFCFSVTDEHKEACYKNLGNSVRSWNGSSAEIEKECSKIKEPNYVNFCLRS